MRDKIRIELSSESRLGWEPFYAVLELPATAQQIKDARHKARITGREDMTYPSIRILGFEPLPNLEHLRLDTTSVEELNYLAQRLDSLSDQQFTVYRALFEQRLGDADSDELLSVKDLINMTYGLDSVMVAPNIWNDEQLGQFVIENDLHPDVAAIPDDSLYLLDKRRIGELQRQNESGVLMDGFYVVAGDYEIPEVYDGAHLPEAEEDDAVFRIKISDPYFLEPEDGDSRGIWVSLPSEYGRAARLARDVFHVPDVEHCVCFGIVSAIPSITGDVFEVMTDFKALNALAERYLHMTDTEQIRYKAILQSEGVESVDQALALADRLGEYELSYFTADSGAFFKEYLAHNLSTRFDSHWLDTLLTQNEGKKLIERLGASITDYGILSARGGHLFDPVPADGKEAIAVEAPDAASDLAEDETQVMGCMQL